MSMSRPTMEVVLDHPLAARPTRKTRYSAGLDLCSVEDIILDKGVLKRINTGLRFSFPEGTYGRIAPLSGLAFYNGIHVMAGVVDQDFRGCVYVVLINLGESAVHIHARDRIAQLICEKIEHPIVRVKQNFTATNAFVRTTGFHSFLEPFNA